MRFFEVKSSKLLTSILFCLVVFLSLRLLFPFFAALLTVMLLTPTVSFLKKHSRLSARALRLFLLMLFLSLGVLLLFVISRRLVREASGFFSAFSDTVYRLFSLLISTWESVREHLHIETGMPAEDLTALLKNILSRASAFLSEGITAWLAAMVKALPKWIAALVFYLLSLVYIALDYEGVCRVLSNLTPAALHEPLRKLKIGSARLLKHTLKAYGILFGVTFGILAIAFTLLSIEYPVWWAWLAAMLDILPAIGVGILLIPWGIALLISQKTALGIAMLLLDLGLVLLRQILEPRILGKELGVHSLVLIVTLFLSLKLFGGWGLLLAPILSVLFTRLFALYQSVLSRKESL